MLVFVSYYYFYSYDPFLYDVLTNVMKYRKVERNNEVILHYVRTHTLYTCTILSQDWVKLSNLLEGNDWLCLTLYLITAFFMITNLFCYRFKKSYKVDSKNSSDTNGTLTDTLSHSIVNLTASHERNIVLVSLILKSHLKAVDTMGDFLGR